MDLGLTGRVVLVAGASRGIGLAVARACLAEGARVCLTARTATDLEDARWSLADAFGADRVTAVVGNMTDPDSIETALDAAEQRLGPLYAVVANVGSGRSHPGIDIGAAEWTRLLSVNLLGGVLLIEQALRRLIPRQDGSITVITSIAGQERIRAPIAYSAAKAALTMAVRHYAAAAGAVGVRVNAVAPGNVLAPGGVWERKLAEDRGAVERYLTDEVPLRRLGTAAEIADLVAFLASPRSAFTTGAVVVADGGQSRSG